LYSNVVFIFTVYKTDCQFQGKQKRKVDAKMLFIIRMTPGTVL